MTDDRLDELLKNALAPEIGDSEIQIRRKSNKNRTRTRLMVAVALAACAVFMLVFGGLNLRMGRTEVPMENVPEGDTVSEAPAEKAERKSNFFVIVSNAEGLSEDATSGDVVNIFTTDDFGMNGYLSGRFGIAGDNISKIGISIDKGEVFTSVPIYSDDPEFAAADSGSAPAGEEYYFAVDDTDKDAYANGENPEKVYHYDHICNKGASFETDYNEDMTFGIHVSETEVDAKDFTKEHYYEMVDQVNDAKLTVTVTFTDGSQEVHQYNIKTGKIFVPVDENENLMYDNLTRFITEEETDVPYIYGYLMEKEN